MPNPTKRHWSLFYSRGTSYERLKNWPAAEADLQKALKLYPDQPLALNYLGYSWVDQNRNLKQGDGADRARGGSQARRRLHRR